MRNETETAIDAMIAELGGKSTKDDNIEDILDRIIDDIGNN